MELTDHGELLVAYAHRALDLNEEGLARLREEPASGTVHLGVSEETLIAGFTRTLRVFAEPTQTSICSSPWPGRPNWNLCSPTETWT